MKHTVVDCECCGKKDLDADDVRKFEGYLVCARCRIVHADELSERRVLEDEDARAVLYEGHLDR